MHEFNLGQILCSSSKDGLLPHTNLTNVKTKQSLNDCILFIVLLEQWKTAYLGKELLWGKKNLATKQHSPQVW